MYYSETKPNFRTYKTKCKRYMDSECNQCVRDQDGNLVTITVDDIPKVKIDPKTDNRWYSPKLSKKDIIMFTNMFGTKTREMNRKHDIILMNRKDSAKAQTMPITTYNRHWYLFKYSEYSYLLGDLRDPFKRRDYDREGVFRSYNGEFNNAPEGKTYKGAILFKEDQEYSTIDSTVGNIKSTFGFVIDIDFRNTMGILSDEDVDTFIKMLNTELSFMGLVAHAYIFTGSGVQVYYMYNKVYWDPKLKDDKVISLLKDAYDHVYKCVAKVAKELVNLLRYTIPAFWGKNKRGFESLEVNVDKISVRRPMVRIPGSIHIRTGNFCNVVLDNRGLPRYQLGELISNAKKYLGILPTGGEWIDYTKKAKSKDIRIFKNNISVLNERRLADLKTILLEYGVGYRNKCYSAIVTIMLNMGYSFSEIVRAIYEFDTQNNVGYFKNLHDAESLVESMINWYERHPKNILGQVELANKAILNFINLTLSDVEDLNLKTLGNIPRAELRANRRYEKLALKKDVAGMYIDQWTSGNTNISEIASNKGLSRTTIYKYLEEFSNEIRDAKFAYFKKMKDLSFAVEERVVEYFERLSLFASLNDIANDLFVMDRVRT